MWLIFKVFEMFNKKTIKVIFDDYDPELAMYNIKNETMNRLNSEINKINREAFTARLNRHQDHINAVLNNK